MKSILFAFLLIIVPIVGNAELVDETVCTELKEDTTCNNKPGCEWDDAIGECGQCGKDHYNDGQDGCKECPANSSTGGKVGATSIDECKCEAGYYMDMGNKTCTKCTAPYKDSVAGATSKDECFMTCPEIENEKGKWDPAEGTVSPSNKCKYTLTCTNYFADWYDDCYGTIETETEPTTDTINRCCVSEIPCAYAWGHIQESTKTIQYKDAKDENLLRKKRNDETVYLSDATATYKTNNGTKIWDFTACTGNGTLYFQRKGGGILVGKADVTITGGPDANWTINIDSQEACTLNNCCSGNTFCGKAQNGYYLTENNTGEDTFLNNKCTPCPMGTTTSDPGARNVNDCHTTKDTRFVDNKGNSFSIADLFGGDIKLNVTQ